MSSEGEQKQWMTRYLLGELSPEEHASFEDRYLADPDLFEQLAAAEDEMIHAYLQGQCSASEKAVMEKRIAASPDWRQKIEFERTLMDHVSSVPAPGSVGAFSSASATGEIPRARRPLVTALRLAAVAVWLLVVLIGGMWLIITNLRLRQELAQVQAQKADLERRQREMQQQLANLSAKPPLAMAPFVLTSHLVRDSNQQKPLVVPPGVTSVPLQLLLDQGLDRFPIYAAALETADGTRLWQQSNLKSQPSANQQLMIAIELPAGFLKRGSYVLKLNGISSNHKPEEVAVYIFHVTRP